MAYDSQSKYEMTLRQARVDIGMGRGNALSKAVDYVIAIHNSEAVKTDDEYKLSLIFEIADKFAKFNQERIDADYAVWLKENDNKLKIDLGIDVPVIQEGEEPHLPLL